MPTYRAATSFVPQFVDANGTPLSGGTISAFLAGTTTATSMFSDNAGTSAGAIVTLNARGEPEVSGSTVLLWVDGDTAYKFVLKDSGGVSIWTVDDVAYAPTLPRVVPDWFATVADMVTSTDLLVGDIVETAGYYAAAGGGGNQYVIVAAATGTADGGSYINLASHQAKGVFPAGINVRQFGAVGDGVAVDTVSIYAAVAVAAGRTLYFPKGTYLTDRIIPEANTNVFLEPGVEIAAISGGTRCFQIQNLNVNISGYGAKTTMDGSQNSHNILISYPAKDCSVRGLHAIGSGNTGDDCFYIGGDPANNNIPENIQIIDCKGEGLGATTRNVVSVVACDGYVIENCEFFNATSSPGAGIDLEANLYMADGTSALKRGIIRRNRIHSNNSGIVIVFGDDCIIEDNEIYNNTGDGIGSAAGGTQFDDSIYRTGDRLGVISFAATGWITVEDTLLLTEDLGIKIGTIVGRRTAVGASWPTEFNTTYYPINEISADQFSFRIGPNFEYGTIVSVTGSGTGTLNKDPTVSDMSFYVYREGNNSNYEIRRNFLYGNGSASAQIKLAQSVNAVVDGNRVIATTTAAITASYCSNIRIENNNCSPAVLSTSVGKGINLGVSSWVSTFNNRVYGFGSEGLAIGGSKVNCDGDTILNCGHSVNRSARFEFGTGINLRGMIVSNDVNYLSSVGLILELSVTASLLTGVNCKGAGLDNASSLSVSGDNVRAVDCIVNDGTFFGERLLTWDAPSIASGASNTTPHTLTGCRPGDFTFASLENNTAGLSVSSSAYNNGVRVTLTNNTGSAVDLASTTLRIKYLAAN